MTCLHASCLLLIYQTDFSVSKAEQRPAAAPGALLVPAAQHDLDPHGRRADQRQQRRLPAHPRPGGRCALFTFESINLFIYSSIYLFTRCVLSEPLHSACDAALISKADSFALKLLLKALQHFVALSSSGWLHRTRDELMHE